MRLLFCAIIKHQTDPGIYLVYVILKGRDHLVSVASSGWFAEDLSIICHNGVGSDDEK